MLSNVSPNQPSKIYFINGLNPLCRHAYYTHKNQMDGRRFRKGLGCNVRGHGKNFSQTTSLNKKPNRQTRNVGKWA